MAPAVKSKEKQLFLGGSLLWVEFDIFLSQQNLISIKCPQPLSPTTAGLGLGLGLGSQTCGGEEGESLQRSRHRHRHHRPFL